MTSVRVRRATPADATAIAEIHVASFKAAHRGLVPLDQLTVERREVIWRDLLGAPPNEGFMLAAERVQQVIGFCHVATPSRDVDSGPVTAELTSIYVSPQQWRSRAGTALLGAAVDDLVAGGWRELTLWVLAANERACDFYVSLGFTADGAEKTHRPSGQREVRLRRPLDGTE